MSAHINTVRVWMHQASVQLISGLRSFWAAARPALTAPLPIAVVIVFVLLAALAVIMVAINMWSDVLIVAVAGVGVSSAAMATLVKQARSTEPSGLFERVGWLLTSIAAIATSVWAVIDAATG